MYASEYVPLWASMFLQIYVYECIPMDIYGYSFHINKERVDEEIIRKADGYRKIERQLTEEMRKNMKL